MKNLTIRKLFLLDGFGAILSAVLLGVVLAKLESFFGIPKSTLYVLAALPCFFACYDFYCYFKTALNLGSFLKGIAIMNLLYCGLSVALAFYHFRLLTGYGWTYMMIEVMIVVALASIEWRVAKGAVKG